MRWLKSIRTRKSSPSADLKKAGEKFVEEFSFVVETTGLKGTVWQPLEGNVPNHEYSVVGKRVYIRPREIPINVIRDIRDLDDDDVNGYT